MPDPKRFIYLFFSRCIRRTDVHQDNNKWVSPSSEKRPEFAGMPNLTGPEQVFAVDLWTRIQTMSMRCGGILYYYYYLEECSRDVGFLPDRRVSNLLILCQQESSNMMNICKALIRNIETTKHNKQIGQLQSQIR